MDPAGRPTVERLIDPDLLVGTSRTVIRSDRKSLSQDEVLGDELTADQMVLDDLVEHR